MKKLRKRISYLLIFALLMCLLPASSGGYDDVYAAVETPTGPVSGTCGDNISWNLTEDPSGWDLTGHGEPYILTLTGSGAMYDFDYGKAPWSGHRVFITSVIIPEGITYIGNNSFCGCSSLTSAAIPDSTAAIGASAFSGCSILETISFGTGLKKIGAGAFQACRKLTSAQFNDGLEELEDYAFYDCLRLQNVSLPESLTSLGTACLGFTDLKRISIPQNVQTILPSAFIQCFYLQEIKVAEGNPHFKVWDNVLYEIKDGTPYRVIVHAAASHPKDSTFIIQEGTEIIDRDAFAGDREPTRTVSVILPSTLREIGSQAFFRTGITAIDIPDNVTVIGQYAFSECDFLKEITIGKGFTDWDHTIFYRCPLVDTITITAENPSLDAVDNVVYNKEHTILYLYAPAKPDESYHLIDTTERIISNSFSKCSFLIKLYLPESLVSMESCAISENKKLKSVFFCRQCPGFPRLQQ